MTEIDNIPRVKLSDMKPLFRVARKIQAAQRRISEENREQLFELFKKSCSADFVLAGISYHVEAEADENFDIASLIFEWVNNDRILRQRIYISYLQSNLGISAVPYFLCAITNRQCRKLYTDGSYFVSRYAFEHRYSQQIQSRKWRKIRQLFKRFDIPKRKNGKGEYRGNLTPYGKKVIKAYQSLPNDMELAAAIMSKRRGRPSKSAKNGASSMDMNLDLDWEF